MLRQRNIPVLTPFSLYDMQHLPVKIQMLKFDIPYFHTPQPTAVNQTDVQKFPLRSNFCTSKRGLHPQLCQSVFAVAKTFNTSADWQNSLRKASFQRKLRQSARRYLQFQKNWLEQKVMKSMKKYRFLILLSALIIFVFYYLKISRQASEFSEKALTNNI